MSNHNLTKSRPQRDGLLFLECPDCTYRLAVDSDNGVIDWTTRVRLDWGDVNVSHTLFVEPPVELAGRVGVEV